MNDGLNSEDNSFSALAINSKGVIFAKTPLFGVYYSN